MVKRLFQITLNKLGKNYEIDQSIPSKMFIYFFWKRFWMLTRGLIFFQKKIFIGLGVNILNAKNIVFGKNVTIENHVSIDGFAKKPLIFGSNVKIGAFSSISCTSHMSKYGEGICIGNNSAFGKYTEFGAAGGIQIGNDVIAGSFISFHSENHNFNNLNLLIREQGVTNKGIVIGNNVWIGAKVTFLDGCKIGNNSVVAAGAVVSGVFPDNVVIGGVPAKILKEL
jgi:acetyltransferase-like isoleucine patch superfamily enzyme